jgi:hypothetical protein
MKRYWCILPSMEAENLGDTRPRQPWRCVITHRRLDRLFVSAVDENGTPDRDPCASACCSPKDLYEKREVALDAYRHHALAYAASLEGEAAEVRRIVAELCPTPAPDP